MSELDRDGVSIYYEVQGEGPVVLLSHGYGATAHMWAPQVPVLSRSHRVVTWDLRGHGRTVASENPVNFSHEASLGDMAALLDIVGAGRAVIGGHSLGGFLSLAFALAHSDRVSALLLLSTGPGYRNPEARSEWNRMAEGYADALEWDGLAGLKIDEGLHGGHHRSAKELALAARGILAQRDSAVLDSLPTIGVPALVMVGERDRPYLGAAEYLAKKLPRATHVLVPDAGHAANIRRPDEINRHLTEFLESLV